VTKFIDDKNIENFMLILNVEKCFENKGQCHRKLHVKMSGREWHSSGSSSISVTTEDLEKEDGVTTVKEVLF